MIEIVRKVIVKGDGTIKNCGVIYVIEDTLAEFNEQIRQQIMAIYEGWTD